MTSELENLGVAAAINLGLATIFVVCYSVASRLPINTRVYFSALFHRDPSKFAETGKTGLERFKLDLRLLDWLKVALKMPQEELIAAAGLDAVVVLRVFFFSLKMLFPMAVWGAVVLIPINITASNIERLQTVNPKSSFTAVDKLSLSNIRDGSTRMWAHLLSAYMFAFWAYYCLWKEYAYITRLRLGYMEDLTPQPDQFTVLATDIPGVASGSGETLSQKVRRYFRVQYPDIYFSHNVVINANPLWALVNKRDKTANKVDALRIQMERKPGKGRPMHRTGFMGLRGPRVDSIDFYEKQLSRLREEAATESGIIQGSQKRVVNAAFVTFRNRWGAAVAAQTQVSKNPQLWITAWAPEPRDVHWPNLGMPKMRQGLRRLAVSTAVFFLVFFYMVPISLVQSLANLNSLRSIGTPIKQILDVPVIGGFVSGFLPGLVLKAFLALLPLLLRTMTTFEGHPSRSTIVRKTAIKMYYFLLVNVFFGSILTGSLFAQLRSFVSSPTALPETLGNAIPSKSTFFITYIMVDGWAGFPAELLRLWPLLLYHVRVACLVTTEKDRDNAMNVQRLQYEQILPSLLFYILLGLVYAPIAPLLLPFLLLFLILGYVVYKNQIINVYERRYETCGALWPFVAVRVVGALLVAQVTLLGVLSLKLASRVAPFAIPLPVLTIVYSLWLRDRFEPNFTQYPLENANAKDVIDSVKYPTWDLRLLSDTAYTHPALAKGLTLDDALPTAEELKETLLVSVKPKYRRASRPGSTASTPYPSRPPSPPRSRSREPSSITDDEHPGDEKV